MTHVSRWMATLAVAAIGCSGDPAETETADTGPGGTFNLPDSDTGTKVDPPTAFVRVINIAVGEAPANLYIDGQAGAVLTGLEPLDGTAFRRVQPGERTFQIGPEDGGGEGSLWASFETELEVDARHTLAIFGGGEDIRLVGFVEDTDSIPKDQARYLFLHGLAGADPIDLWDVSEPKPTDPVLPNLAFGKGPVPIQRDDLDWRLGVDVDADDVVDAEFDIPDLGPRVSIPLYFAADGTELLMVGQSPSGALQIQRVELEEKKATPKPKP